MSRFVFISGRVSGIKYENAKKNFRKAEKLMESEGLFPVNPLKLCKQEWSWLRCMIVCLWYLAKCDNVYFMRNYKKSRGARIEYKVAKWLGKTIITEYDR